MRGRCAKRAFVFWAQGPTHSEHESHDEPDVQQRRTRPHLKVRATGTKERPRTNSSATGSGATRGTSATIAANAAVALICGA